MFVEYFEHAVFAQHTCTHAVLDKQHATHAVHHEKLSIPSTGIQFIPVLHTGIWHTREYKIPYTGITFYIPVCTTGI